MNYISTRHVPLAALPVNQRAAILEARRLYVARPFDLQAFLAATKHCNEVLNPDQYDEFHREIPNG